MNKKLVAILLAGLTLTASLQGSKGADSKPAEEPKSDPAPETKSDDPNKDGQNKTQNQPQVNGTNKQLLDAIQEIASSFYTTSLNTIVRNLFTNTYNDFKGVIDDYDTMKKGGTDAKDQQTNNQKNAQ